MLLCNIVHALCSESRINGQCCCDVRNYLAFRGVYQSGIIACMCVAYAIENESVFSARVGVSDPKTRFTNGLNDG